MLLQITIHNFILIEKVTLDFVPNLNIVTGETGAGKSIFLSALGATFGERISTDQILPGRNTLKVSTTFSIQDHLEVKTALDEIGVDYEDNLLTLRREVSRDGKSRCYVNGMICRVGHLKQLAELLIDIHGQHQNQYLFNAHHHGRIFDHFSENEDLLESYREVYENWFEKKKKLDEILRKEKQLKKEKDFLIYTVEELEKGIVKEEEYHRLKASLNTLEHSEKLSTIFNQLDTLLFSTLIPGIDKGIISLDGLGDLQMQIDPIKNNLLEAKGSLEEAKHFITPYLDKVDPPSPTKLDEINEKLSKIERLKKKYQKTINELIDLLEESKKKLQFLENVDHERGHIEKELNSIQRQVLNAAGKLHQTRVAKRDHFIEVMHEELSYLGMEESKINVAIIPRESEDGIFFIDRKILLNEEGMDKIEFSYAPNLNSDYKKLKDIASGGEISRFMLSLKSILSNRVAMQTMVFDEIDTGIGGNTAVNVGKKIKSLSTSRQLIVITHLPPIAKHANRHFRVEKISEQGETTTIIKELSSEEKVEEISRMISGEKHKPDSLLFARKFIEE